MIPTSPRLAKRLLVQLFMAWYLFLVGTSGFKISLCEPLAGIHHLNDVDILLESHDRQRDQGDDPWEGAVNLVRTSHLECTSTPGAGKEAAQRGVGRRTGLRGGRLRIRDGLEQRGRQHRRGEGEEVKTNEKQFVSSAADEQNSLQLRTSRLA